MPGRRSLTAAATPGDQAAAADPDHHDVQVRNVLEQLQADRAVAGDDRRVVERVDELEALGVADPLHLGEGLADVGPMQDDSRAVAETRVHLRADGTGGHGHGDRNASRPAGPGVGLPGVSRREGDHAAGPGCLGQRGDPVGHAARLERAGLLEVLRLEVQAVVAQTDPTGRRNPVRGRRRAHHRRSVHSPGETFAGGLDLRDRDEMV